MADTREFSSSMSTPQSGNANLNIVVGGVDHEYNPFGADVRVVIPSNGINVFIDAPAQLDAVASTVVNEGAEGQAKYVRCMEILGDGCLPVCTGRQGGPAGTHGKFAPLSYITDDCKLCFQFINRTNDTTITYVLDSSGTWTKIE